MIANARMYAVSPSVAVMWRDLLSAVSARAGVPVTVIDHAEPAPIDELWRRQDLAAVFMCGLPFSRAAPQPVLLAAPVPSPAEFGGEARYWSELVVRADSAFQSVSDTFGKRLALTVPDSQSGCVAALSHFMSYAHESTCDDEPLFGEIIAPTVTPWGALSAVIGGAADLAPIDSYAFSLLTTYRPDLTSQVRSVGRTAATPIPPLVASRAGFEALGLALADAHRPPATRPLLDGLLLERFVRPDPAAYDVLRDRFETATRYWSSRHLATVTHPAFAL